MSLDEIVTRHYGNPSVQREIVRFSKGRWVGLHCVKRDRADRPYLIRYLGRTTPLRIEEAEDVGKLLRIFRRLGPRTFYATANIYERLEEVEDVAELSNIKACMPTWDVDNALENWPATIAAVGEIVSFLEANGVERSVFIKWSGRGCHIHIHEGAISREMFSKANPLDLAYAIVEYTNTKLKEKYTETLVREASKGLRVDNEMDPQRLFTCPLSLHKELNKVCVCIDLNDMDNFTPEWADLDGYRHFDKWTEHVVGEADELAWKAYETIGPCPSIPRLRRRRHPALDEQITHWLRRFKDEKR